jgi:hypothetical protein
MSESGIFQVAAKLPADRRAGGPPHRSKLAWKRSARRTHRPKWLGSTFTAGPHAVPLSPATRERVPCYFTSGGRSASTAPGAVACAGPVRSKLGPCACAPRRRRQDSWRSPTPRTCYVRVHGPRATAGQMRQPQQAVCRADAGCATHPGYFGRSDRRAQRREPNCPRGVGPLRSGRTCPR